MKNSILMGALVLAVALLPSLASADSASYDLEFGESAIVRLAGGPLDVPALDETEGTAVIAGMAWVPTDSEWVVHVLCLAPSCRGAVVN